MPGPHARDERPSDLDSAVARLAEHLRRLPESRLRRHHDELGPGTTADAAHRLAQWLADAAARSVAGEDPPTLRPVPRLSDLAVGDQVAVTGHELADALSDRGTSSLTAPLLAEAMARVAEVRRHA